MATGARRNIRRIRNVVGHKWNSGIGELMAAGSDVNWVANPPLKDENTGVAAEWLREHTAEACSTLR